MQAIGKLVVVTVSELAETVSPLSMSEVEIIEAGSCRSESTKVWNLLNHPSASSSKCLVCGAIVNRPAVPTTPLLNHLKSHEGARKEYESASSAAVQRKVPKCRTQI